ncbi:MAG TPA: phosphotransferase [Rhizomicrobium sp.]|jgi:aminoglycoside phosphotransferase (APT) family kinase protein|nr:phosphotransferase [Rhizomicrobium sp.]
MALAHFGLDDSALLGKGGQSRVYALDGTRVLRLYRAETHPRFAQALAAFYAALDVPPLPFAIPQIHETGTIDGVLYAIEARLAGTPLTDAFPTLDAPSRSHAVMGFLQAAAALRRIRHPQTEFGELLTADPIRRASWRDFLLAKGEARARECAAWLRQDVPDLDRALARYRALVAQVPDRTPGLVHGDYYGANVMVARDGTVAAVIDFSPLSLIGDGRLDVIGARHALEALGIAPHDKVWADDFLRQAFAPDGQDLFDAYSGYFALLHAGAREEVPPLYRWCVETLNALSA